MSLRYYMSTVHGHFQRDVKICLKRTQNIVQNHNVFKEQYHLSGTGKRLFLSDGRRNLRYLNLLRFLNILS